MTFFLSFLMAMFVTMLLIPPLMRTAQRMQFLDVPNERKVHTQAIPRIGGVAMVCGAVLSIVLWIDPSRQIVALLLAMCVILVFGVWDDRKDLDYRIKFLGQLIAAAIVVLYGGIVIETVPFGGLTPLRYELAVPLSIFVLLAVTNAINLADGLDGLAGGTTLLSIGVIALLGYIHDNVAVTLVAVAVIGSILGFLRFNTFPARIFMGDGGSQFLGFSLGVLLVLLTGTSFIMLSPALPVLLLGLPMLDTAMVMAQRIYGRRSPFSADKNHIHHRLLALGFDHYEAVSIIYVVQGTLVTAAYLLRSQDDGIILTLYFTFCLSVVLLFRWAHVTRWQLRKPLEAEGASPLTRKLRLLRDGGTLTRMATTFATAGVPAYLFIGAVAAQHVALDIGLLALGALILMLVMYPKTRGRPIGSIERVGLYVLSTLVVYMTYTSPGYMQDIWLLRAAFFIVLAVVVAIGFRFASSTPFRLTPLDILVIFVAFTVPNLPGLDLPAIGNGEFIAKIIVLFYAIELILTYVRTRCDVLRYIFFSILGVIVVRGMMSL